MHVARCVRKAPRQPAGGTEPGFVWWPGMPFCLGQAVHRASTQSQYTEPALDLALLNGENFIAAYINEIVSYNMNVVRIF